MATKTFPYNYVGKPIKMWRLGAGPGGIIYGGAALPAWLSKLYDPANPSVVEQVIGQTDGAQYYAFLTDGPSMWMSQYGSASVWMKYNPAAAFTPKPWVAGPTSNPLGVAGGSAWRPNSLLKAPDGYLYSGSSSGYGTLNGPFIRIDPVALTSTVIYPYADQSIDGLLVTPSAAAGVAGAWALLGSTSRVGGGGSIPTATTIEVFTIDPNTFTVANKTPFPITGVDVSQVVTDGTTCYVLGTDQDTDTSYIATYNHVTDVIGSATSLPFSKLIYNSCVFRAGNIVGLCDSGVFSIPIADFTQAWVAGIPNYPIAKIITGSHFDSASGTWYFAIDTTLWRYVMP